MKHHSRRLGRPQLGFLDLPAEIRNKIYRLSLITGRVLLIRDMFPPVYMARKKSGLRPLRSTYTAPDHVLGSSGDEWPIAQCPPRLPLVSLKEKFETTTYKLMGAAGPEGDAIKLLALSRQIRQEAGSIFYGENTFHFTTMSSLVPFFKDRMPDTRHYINSVQLALHILPEDWYPAFLERGRPQAWKRAFSALCKLPNLNIKQLCIRLDDSWSQMYTEGLCLHTPEMRWLHKLGEISSLDSLGVEYITRCAPAGLLIEGNVIQGELWEFLAPKMLTKRNGEDHDAEALQYRRGSMAGFAPSRFARANEQIYYEGG